MMKNNVIGRKEESAVLGCTPTSTAGLVDRSLGMEVLFLEEG